MEREVVECHFLLSWFVLAEFSYFAFCVMNGDLTVLGEETLDLGERGLEEVRESGCEGLISLRVWRIGVVGEDGFELVVGWYCWWCGETFWYVVRDGEMCRDGELAGVGVGMVGKEDMCLRT